MNQDVLNILRELETELLSNNSTYPELYAIRTAPAEQRAAILEGMDTIFRESGDSEQAPDVGKLMTLFDEHGFDSLAILEELNTANTNLNLLGKMQAIAKEKGESLAEELRKFGIENPEALIQEHTPHEDSPSSLAAENDASCMTDTTGGEDPCYRHETPDGEKLGTETVYDALWEAEETGIVQDPYYEREEIIAPTEKADNLEINERAKNDTPEDINHEQYAELGMSWTSQGLMNDATGEIVANNTEELGVIMWYGVTPDAPHDLRRDGNDFLIPQDAASNSITFTEDPSVLDIDMSNAVRVPVTVENVEPSGHGLPAEAQCVSDNPFEKCPSK